MTRYEKAIEILTNMVNKITDENKKTVALEKLTAYVETIKSLESKIGNKDFTVVLVGTEIELNEEEVSMLKQLIKMESGKMI